VREGFELDDLGVEALEGVGRVEVEWRWSIGEWYIDLAANAAALAAIAWAMDWRRPGWPVPGTSCLPCRAAKLHLLRRHV
jgi:hypothetical protein